MSDRDEYCELGALIDGFARKRGARGPARIAARIREETGSGPSPSAWSQILRGETREPRYANIMLFAEAFDLDDEERQELANAYLFRDAKGPVAA